MPKTGSALPTTGRSGIAGIVLHADVHGRVVHVVLDALAVGGLEPQVARLRRP